MKLENSNLEAGHPPEVGHAGDGVGQLLDLVEVVRHADSLLHLRRHGGYSKVGMLRICRYIDRLMQK